MELQHPLTVVTPTVDGAVLTVLARADAEFTTGRLQALLPRYSTAGIRKVCQRLERQGIVLARSAGQAQLYSLNRHHLAADAIIELATAAIRLLARMCEDVAAWEIQPAYCAVFGSAATGTMTADSDIDVFILRPDGTDVDHSAWRTQLDGFAFRVHAWTGNDCRILEMSQAEAAEGSARGEPVLSDIKDVGLPITGPSTT